MSTHGSLPEDDSDVVHPLAVMRTLALFLFSVLWFAAVGPLIGGAPWNIFIVTIPMSYLLGIVPAVIAGTLYGLLLVRSSITRKPMKNSFLQGAICGSIATLACFFVYVSSVPDGLALINPVNAVRMSAEIPRIVVALVALLPVMLVGTFGGLGAAAGAFCAHYFPKIVLAKLLAQGAPTDQKFD